MRETESVCACVRACVCACVCVCVKVRQTDRQKEGYIMSWCTQGSVVLYHAMLCSAVARHVTSCCVVLCLCCVLLCRVLSRHVVLRALCGVKSHHALFRCVMLCLVMLCRATSRHCVVLRCVMSHHAVCRCVMQCFPQRNRQKT